MKKEIGKKKSYKVVIAVADDLFGDELVEFAKKHNWPAGTQFHLIHALEPNPLKNPLLVPEEVIEQITRDEEQSGKDLINDVARKLYACTESKRVKRHLKVGDARQSILKLAADLKADMILIGSHGRRGIRRFLLGSVAEAVVTHAPCSTVIVRIPGDEVNFERLFEFTAEDLPEEMRGDIALYKDEEMRV